MEAQTELEPYVLKPYVVKGYIEIGVMSENEDEAGQKAKEFIRKAKSKQRHIVGWNELEVNEITEATEAK